MGGSACLHPSSSLLPRLLLSPSSLPSLPLPLHGFTPSSSLSYTPSVYSMARRNSTPKSKQDKLASSADLQFEAPLRIVEYPNPLLRAKNKRISTFDDNLKRLADEMFDVMYKTDGIGLSAPQVGVNVQLMVFNHIGERGEGEEVVLVNPKVSRYSRKILLYEEGCLSFPGINADVERPDSINVDAQDISGSKFSLSLSGLRARVFQHEFDHLQGILFFDKMSDEVVDSIRMELEKLEKKYEDSTGLPSPEKIAMRRRKTTAVGFGIK